MSESFTSLPLAVQLFFVAKFLSEDGSLALYDESVIWFIVDFDYPTGGMYVTMCDCYILDLLDLLDTHHIIFQGTCTYFRSLKLPHAWLYVYTYIGNVCMYIYVCLFIYIKCHFTYFST